jgi:hypothetical protein
VSGAVVTPEAIVYCITISFSESGSILEINSSVLIVDYIVPESTAIARVRMNAGRIEDKIRTTEIRTIGKYLAILDKDITLRGAGDGITFVIATRIH